MNSVLIILFPIVIVLLIGAIIIKATMQNAKFLNGKVIMLLVAGYIGLLLVSVIFTYTLPTDSDTVNAEKGQEIAEEFYRAIHTNGNLDEVDGLIVTDHWKFPFSEDNLEIKTWDQYNNTWIMIDNQTSFEDKIEITRYITPHIFENIDYTELLQSPKLQFQGKELTIIPPDRTEIRLSKFHKEFTITQFTRESMFRGDGNSWSANILYVKLPKNVKVTADEYMNLQFRQ